MRRQQRGSALIIAMLIAALVAAISVRLAEAFYLQVDQAESRQQTGWQQVYVQGAETLALRLLDADSMQTSVDHLQESWAQSINVMPTDHGWIRPALQDAQALFNLNNVLIKSAYADDAGAALAIRLSPMQKQFVRLLQSFPDYPVSEADAVMMTEALIDWIDADDYVSGQGGAESLYYSAFEPALQPANQPLTDVSELVHVRYFTPQLIERLRPWVTVLPAASALNLNTTQVQILATLNRADKLQPLALESLQVLDNLRRRQVFNSIEEFFQHPDVQRVMSDAEQNSGVAQVSLFSVSSQWFVLTAAVSTGLENSQWQSLLFRPQHDPAEAVKNSVPQVWSRSRQW
jgi:general secretion pathway protein K